MDLKKINLKQIRAFSRTSPIYFSLGFTLLAVLVHEAFSRFFRLLPDGTWMDILNELVFIIWPVALAVIFGFGFIFLQRGIRATVGAALPIFLAFGYLVAVQLGTMADNPDTLWKSELEIFQGVLLLLGIGIQEETLYRGVITNAIARKYANTTKGLWITAFSAGAMFGAMHLANVFHGSSFAGVLTQAIGCIASGVLYSAIYLRGGSIWVVALLHSLRDTPALVKILFIKSTESLSKSVTGMIGSYRPDLTMVMFFAAELLLAAFLLRKSKQQKIFDRLEKLNASEAANA